MCDNSQFIDWLKLPFPLYIMEYTIGECKELLVSLTTHSFTLLVTVCLNFGTHHEVSAHICLYSFPLPFLAIKVHCFIVDKHFFYRRHLQHCLGRYLYVDGSIIETTVDTKHTLVLLEIIRKDVKQRSHKEVGYLCHSITVLVAEHIAYRFALFI